jgi:hypothetical protein
MKSKILAAVILIITTVTTSFAHDNSNFPVIRKISITSTFDQIIVDRDLQVVLVQPNGDSQITIAGDEKNVDGVEMNVVNGELVLTANKNTNTDNVTVYIPVRNLSLVRLASGASVSGEGVLKFDNLTVVVNNESQVNLKVQGKLKVNAADGCELVFDRNERSKLR